MTLITAAGMSGLSGRGGESSRSRFVPAFHRLGYLAIGGQRKWIRAAVPEKLAYRVAESPGDCDDFDVGESAILVLDPGYRASVDQQPQPGQASGEVLLGNARARGPAEFADTGSEEIAAGCRRGPVGGRIFEMCVIHTLDTLPAGSLENVCESHNMHRALILGAVLSGSPNLRVSRSPEQSTFNRVHLKCSKRLYLAPRSGFYRLCLRPMLRPHCRRTPSLPQRRRTPRNGSRRSLPSTLHLEEPRVP